MTRHLYRSGMGWAFWRWTDNVPHLRRLHLVKLPSGRAIMLHWHLGPDPQPDKHDHPVSFLSLVLRGSYVELTASHCQWIEWWNFKAATDIHRITWVAPGTVTLVVCGPKVREWGFHTPNGWVPWREYRG